MLWLFAFLPALVLSISDCSAIDPGDGTRVYRTKQLFYSMLFPNTFIITLLPEARCYYVSNNMVQAKWNSPDLEGTLYVYGFQGYDGFDKNSCQLSYQEEVD